MALKRRVVIQTENGCKLLTNPKPEQYKGKVHVVDPDLSSVYGLSPERWVINGRSVIPQGTQPRKKQSHTKLVLIILASALVAAAVTAALLLK